MPAGGSSAASEEQAKVIPDFSGGCNGRSGIVPAGSLVDRDGGGQPFDRLDIGFLHLIQELPCVGTERLHVLALTLSKDRIEGQGAFTGT